MLSRLSRVLLCASLWTVAHQALLSMEFSGQESWGGLPRPSLGGLSNPGIKPASPASPALAGGFSATVPPGCYSPAQRGPVDSDCKEGDVTGAQDSPSQPVCRGFLGRWGCSRRWAG